MPSFSYKSTLWSLAKSKGFNKIFINKFHHNNFVVTNGFLHPHHHIIDLLQVWWIYDRLVTCSRIILLSTLKMHTFVFQPLKHHMLQPLSTTLATPQLAMPCKHLCYAFYRIFAKDNQHQKMTQNFLVTSHGGRL